MSVTVAGMIRPLVVTALLAIAATLAPSPAQAWGPKGHRLVARLAEARLSPDARSEVLRLLAVERQESLADIANWADELRQNDPDLGRRSARWHFVNIGEHDCRYDAARACPGGDCIVEAIRAQSAILADRTRSDRERLQALKFVVHLVGDVHQPMHAGYARDRGGNTVQVNYRGRGSNLHALWDSTLLNAHSEDAYYLRLRGERPRRSQAADASLSPERWAERACRIVTRPGVYPASARIGEDYIERHRPIAEEAIRQAGDNLARLLDRTLG